MQERRPAGPKACLGRPREGLGRKAAQDRFPRSTLLQTFTTLRKDRRTSLERGQNPRSRGLRDDGQCTPCRNLSFGHKPKYGPETPQRDPVRSAGRPHPRNMAAARTTALSHGSRHGEHPPFLRGFHKVAAHLAQRYTLLREIRNPTWDTSQHVERPTAQTRGCIRQP